MTFVHEIRHVLESWAPLDTAEPWDNVGLMIGDNYSLAKRVLCAFEIDRYVWNYLAEEAFDVIITHHPLFFRPIQSLDVSTETGRIVKRLIKNNMTCLSYHTNLDKAKGGVNDQLVRAYDFDPEDGHVFDSGFGKWFEFETVKPLSYFTEIFPGKIRGAIGGVDVKRVAFCAGSGKSLIDACKEHRIDLLVTGEIGYHESVTCDFYGIKVLEIGHKESEVLILQEIKNRLKGSFSDLDVQVLSQDF